MNCKEGDLAIVVKSCCGNEGKIVRCLKLLGLFDLYGPNGQIGEGLVWRIDTPLPDFDGDLAELAEDRQLRPIRDNPGEDETLTWAPRKEPVAA